MIREFVVIYLIEHFGMSILNALYWVSKKKRYTQANLVAAKRGKYIDFVNITVFFP